ncbi:MAG: molybdenum cofactor guanylyltransferase [Chloroflexota bacterium]|nr:MAG: molybdenum cofactor guanylyltransferase [Chloroflexota bacterium]
MLSIVIQSGGSSSRMGQDKALVPFLGRPLIERIVQRLAPLAGEIWINTNRPEAYEFLGLPLVADRIPGRGALGGLYTCLSAATLPLVAVVACDMPFVNRGLLAAACDLLLHPEDALPPDAGIPRTVHGVEPFHAVYRKETCLPAVEAAVQAGKWRVDSWFSAVNIRWIAAEEIERHDPRQCAFINVNTPEDLAKAEQLARSEPDL